MNNLGTSETRAAFQAACNAWSVELQRQFGKRAGDIRYTAQGAGEPGTVLRERYDAFHAARIAFDASRIA